MKSAVKRSGCAPARAALPHEALVQVLGWVRYRYQTERELRDVLAEYFIAQGMTRVVRNVALSTGETLDFLTPAGTGIAVRLEGTTSEILLSLADVAAAREVVALIVVTDRPRAAPATIGGKPLVVFFAGRQT